MEQENFDKLQSMGKIQNENNYQEGNGDFNDEDDEEGDECNDIDSIHIK